MQALLIPERHAVFIFLKEKSRQQKGKSKVFLEFALLTHLLLFKAELV
jgi:hypothetical protein